MVAASIHKRDPTLRVPRLTGKGKKPEPTVLTKFLAAGAAACAADSLTFPLDVAKVRLQIQGEGTKQIAAVQPKIGVRSGATAAVTSAFKYRGIFGTLKTIVFEEGVRGLYSGIVPGLQRQWLFASIRIGLYDSTKATYQTIFSQIFSSHSLRKTQSQGKNANFAVCVAAGLTTGTGAILVAQPTDVVKVRMQAQSVASGGRARYTGCLDAYRKIAAQEGIKGLWKGSIPNIMRNSVVNCSELVTYDLIKQKIIKYRLLKDGVACHFSSGLCAGFVTTVIASPIDVVKTRLMNSPPGKYNGIADLCLRMFHERGLRAFYKGFMPSFARLGAWNIAMFMFYEQFKKVVLPSFHQEQSSKVSHRH